MLSKLSFATVVVGLTGVVSADGFESLGAFNNDLLKAAREADRSRGGDLIGHPCECRDMWEFDGEIVRGCYDPERPSVMPHCPVKSYHCAVAVEDEGQWWRFCDEEGNREAIRAQEFPRPSDGGKPIPRPAPTTATTFAVKGATRIDVAPATTFAAQYAFTTSECSGDFEPITSSEDCAEAAMATGKQERGFGADDVSVGQGPNPHANCMYHTGHGKNTVSLNDRRIGVQGVGHQPKCEAFGFEGCFCKRKATTDTYARVAGAKFCALTTEVTWKSDTTLGICQFECSADAGCVAVSWFARGQVCFLSSVCDEQVESNTDGEVYFKESSTLREMSKCVKHAGSSNEGRSCCGLEAEISCPAGYKRVSPVPNVCGGDCPASWCNHKGDLKNARSYQCVKERCDTAKSGKECRASGCAWIRNPRVFECVSRAELADHKNEFEVCYATEKKSSCTQSGICSWRKGQCYPKASI